MNLEQAQRSNRLYKVVDFLGLRRSIVALLGMVILVGLGEKMAERFLPLYLMALAFVVRGLKEFGEPTRKALILDLAAEDKKASTFGIYYLLRDLVVSVAAFAGAFLWSAETAQFLFDLLGFGHGLLPLFEDVASPATNFLVAFGFGLAGTLYFTLRGEEVSYPITIS